MIDPVICWIEIRSVAEAIADLVANEVELVWLARYPLPNNIMVDIGKELSAEFKAMMANDYGILCNSICVRNLKTNAIMERVHQTIGNIIRTFKVQQMDLDNENSLIYYICSKVYGAHCYAAHTVATGTL